MYRIKKQTTNDLCAKFKSLVIFDLIHGKFGRFYGTKPLLKYSTINTQENDMAITFILTAAMGNFRDFKIVQFFKTKNSQRSDFISDCMCGAFPIAYIIQSFTFSALRWLNCCIHNIKDKIHPIF